jgi:hypothetical protein
MGINKHPTRNRERAARVFLSRAVVSMIPIRVGTRTHEPATKRANGWLFSRVWSRTWNNNFAV